MAELTPLKRMLFERQLSIRWLEEKTGASYANLNTIVNGKHLPTLLLGMKIARTLDVTVEELWGYRLEDEQS